VCRQADERAGTLEISGLEDPGANIGQSLGKRVALRTCGLRNLGIGRCGEPEPSARALERVARRGVAQVAGVQAALLADRCADCSRRDERWTASARANAVATSKSAALTPAPARRREE
jgi:hypothetical protein